MARLFKSANVISAMPAMGKTYVAKKFPNHVRDLESSEYHWKMDPDTKEFILDSDGNKILNEEWPMNYIETIKVLDKSGMYKAIMVSSHEEIRKLMAENGIKYANVYATDDMGTIQSIMARCVFRHSKPSFINDYRQNFSKYSDSMKNDTGSVVNIGIDEKNLDRWIEYLFQE